MRKGEGKPCSGSSLLFPKSTKGDDRLNVPIHRRIATNTYIFTSYVLRINFRIKPGTFGTKTRDKVMLENKIKLYLNRIMYSLFLVKVLCYKRKPLANKLTSSA